MSDAAYNAESRVIEVKFDIHLGTGEPLHVTKDNYLVDATILEEAQADSKSVLDDVSSNELTITLYNDNNIFTPTNTSSPYYGQIRKDVRIDAYGRATTLDESAEWQPLGKYYVKEWSTSSSSLVASITANDAMYNIFDAQMPTYYVKKNTSIKDFYTEYFNLLGASSNIDESLTSVLPFAYTSGSNKEFLSDLTKGALALCYCDRLGKVKVLNRLSSPDLRATLTDADQIVNVDSTQSIETGYDGAYVVCNAPQESAVQELISIKDRAIKIGINEFSNLAFSSTPLVRLSYINVYSADSVVVSNVAATPSTVNFRISSETATTSANISVAGTCLENISSTTADTGSNLMALDSLYVQNDEQAALVANYIRRALVSKVPMLNVAIRGNFLLKIGDKVRIVSDRFKTDYTGIIIRSNYSYGGGLSCTLTLMDAALFGEVT